MEAIAGFIQTIINFFRVIWEAFKNLFEWLGDAYDAFIDFLKNLPEWTFSKLVDGFISYFEAIPVPEFFNQAASAFSGIPPEVVYFAQPLHIGTGVTMVLGAYWLRFIVRRLPFFG